MAIAAPASILRCFAASPRGLGELVRGEVVAAGGEVLELSPGGVAFTAGLETAYRLCLWSRVASRVLVEIGRFPAPDEEALYAGARTLPWADHVPSGATIAVACTTQGSPIRHSHYAALKLKDALVDELRDRRGHRPTVATTRPAVALHLHLAGEAATVSVDLAGESLHRRGYRLDGAQAPLKENLAAALLLLAGWPRRAEAGEPLCDPMCGSGTLVLEAVAIAADLAPGLGRDYFGLHGWGGHDGHLWRRLLAEARQRRQTLAEPGRFLGLDREATAIAAATANLARLGMGDTVRLVVGELEELRPPPGRPGLLVVNPPYGERLGEGSELPALYRQLGDLLRRRFGGWSAWVLAGNPDLAKAIGLRAASRHPVWNGPLECRFLEYPIAAAAPLAGDGPGWRRQARERASAFANRIQKNLRHLRKWARREGVTCFRVYDADLLEYNLAVDLYEDAAQVQEYAPPPTVDPGRAAERLAAALEVLPEVLGVAPAAVHLKVRRRHARGEQYERQDDRGELKLVHEGGLRLLVNLSDYLDTGLYLDQRQLRGMIREEARGRDFLNLFCYTGSATVYAAAGGARTTTSVDLSHTYLEWASKNLAENRFVGPGHRLIRGDCLAFLAEPQRRFGLIFLAPPTFSASKAMRDVLDLQRDHVRLITQAAALLTPDGTLLFASHFRKLDLDLPALAGAGLQVVEITGRTLPPDFARDPRYHRTFRIVRG